MGHGHVIPNPDGSKARCGGPALCSVCAKELAANYVTSRPAAQTLGQALSALLRANGVPGPVVSVEGGPAQLAVYYQRPDGSEAATLLDLQADAHPAGPIQHGTVDQLMRDTEADD